MNGGDLGINAEAWGRKIDTLPALPQQTEPWPPVPTPTANRYGDLNGDGVVDAYDLALFDDRIALCGSELYSGMFDVNHDYEISEADREIIAGNIQDPPHCLMDVTGDGCVSMQDAQALGDQYSTWGEICDPADEHWNPLYDVNCDGCINVEDYQLIASSLKHGWQCPNCPNP